MSNISYTRDAWYSDNEDDDLTVPLDLNEFPCIGAEIEVHPERRQSKPIEKREPIRIRHQEPMNERARGFETLKNPTRKTKNPVNSKMCQKVLRNETCKNNNCTYAHSIEKLNPAECVFKNSCKFQDNSRCLFIHPNEDREDFLYRIGLKKKILQRPVVSEEEESVVLKNVTQPLLDEVITLRCTISKMYDIVPVFIEEGFKNIHIHLTD
jgi:hypothetical protein